MIDEIRGKVVEMYVALKPGVDGTDEEVAKKVSAQIERDIGKIARPKNVWVVPDMPKTRSGKIMRRVIAGISNFADVGDVSTLANPEVVEKIREQVQRRRRSAARTSSFTDRRSRRSRSSGRARSRAVSTFRAFGATVRLWREWLRAARGPVDAACLAKQ